MLSVAVNEHSLRHELKYRGKSVRITPAQFKLFEMLIEGPTERQAMIDRLDGVNRKTFAMHLSHCRKYLKELAAPYEIVKVWGQKHDVFRIVKTTTKKSATGA